MILETKTWKLINLKRNDFDMFQISKQLSGGTEFSMRLPNLLGIARLRLLRVLMERPLWVWGLLWMIQLNRIEYTSYPAMRVLEVCHIWLWYHMNIVIVNSGAWTCRWVFFTRTSFGSLASLASLASSNSAPCLKFSTHFETKFCSSSQYLVSAPRDLLPFAHFHFLGLQSQLMLLGNTCAMKQVNASWVVAETRTFDLFFLLSTWRYVSVYTKYTKSTCISRIHDTARFNGDRWQVRLSQMAPWPLGSCPEEVKSSALKPQKDQAACFPLSGFLQDQVAGNYFRLWVLIWPGLTVQSWSWPNL